jgi:hypothetical protein
VRKVEQNHPIFVPACGGVSLPVDIGHVLQAVPPHSAIADSHLLFRYRTNVFLHKNAKSLHRGTSKDHAASS